MSAPPCMVQGCWRPGSVFFHFPSRVLSREARLWSRCREHLDLCGPPAAWEAHRVNKSEYLALLVADEVLNS